MRRSIAHSVAALLMGHNTWSSHANAAECATTPMCTGGERVLR